MSNIDDDIKILNLEENFKNLSQEDQEKTLANAWRKFSLKWHPDRNKNPEAEVIFKMGNNANENIKEYIKKGYFSLEDAEDYTNEDWVDEDTYEDENYKDETYTRTETKYNKEKNSQYWEKYYNSDNEKGLFLNSSIPLKIILTVIIVVFASFIIVNIGENSTPLNTQTQKENSSVSTNNSSTNTQKISSNNNFEYSVNEKQDYFEPWMNEFVKRIKMNWDPPKGNESMRVVLLIKVAKNGRLLDCTITKSSGIQNVDNAAINAVKLAAPFRPLPDEYKISSADIEFTFDYNAFKKKYNSTNNKKSESKNQSYKNQPFKMAVPTTNPNIQNSKKWTPNPSLVPIGGQ